MADNKKAALGAAIGALDPILKNWAQKLAKGVASNSPLRSELFGVALGVVKGFVEALAGKLPPTASIVVEKITDFSDFFTGALGGVSEKEKKVAVNDWMDSFFYDAGIRFRKAKDPKVEAEKMKSEFECRLVLLNLIEESKSKPVSKNEPFINWSKEIESLEKKWQEKWKPQLLLLDNSTALKIRDFRKSLTWLRPRVSR